MTWRDLSALVAIVLIVICLSFTLSRCDARLRFHEPTEGVQF